MIVSVQTNRQCICKVFQRTDLNKSENKNTGFTSWNAIYSQFAIVVKLADVPSNDQSNDHMWLFWPGSTAFQVELNRGS